MTMTIREYESVIAARSFSYQLLQEHLIKIANIRKLAEVPNTRTLGAYNAAAEFYKQSGALNNSLDHGSSYGIFEVEAYHAGKDSTGLDVSAKELENSAFTLSYKPLTINHGWTEKYREARALQYPTNQTLEMWYDPEIEGVRGQILVSEPEAWYSIKRRDIRKLSVEFHSMGASEGQGMIFTSLSLITNEATPADDKARIIERSKYGAVKHNPERIPPAARKDLKEVMASVARSMKPQIRTKECTDKQCLCNRVVFDGSD